MMDDKAHVQLIGELNIELFRKLFPHIATAQVVLTDKQKQHIIQRHPEVFRRHASHLQEIIQQPDWILGDPKHVDTVLMIKQYENAAMVVLRLCTDNSGKQNSIITMWETKQARLQRYLLTHATLFEQNT